MGGEAGEPPARLNEHLVIVEFSSFLFEHS